MIAIIIAMLAFAGCSGTGSGGGAGSNGGATPGEGAHAGADAEETTGSLTGTPDEILERVLGSAGGTLSSEDDIHDFFIEPVTAENAPAMLGMMPDDFVSFADEGAVALSEDPYDAFQASIVKCKSSDYALMVSDIIQSGFDSGKWEVSMPKQSLVMVSGYYVLLAVGRVSETDAIAESFQRASAGNASGPYIFYEWETA